MWDIVGEDDNCEICACTSMMNRRCTISNNCCNKYINQEACRDKENISPDVGSPLKSETEISLYSSNANFDFPQSAFEYTDSNSRDSGYGALGESERFYEMAKSLGVTPRRDNRMSDGIDSIDDEFFEFVNLEPPSVENSRLPSDFNSLINSPFSVELQSKQVSPEFTLSFRPLLVRSQSLNNETTPTTNKVRSCLFKDDVKSFKRPDPPSETKSPVEVKRSRVLELELDNEEEENEAAVPVSRPVLRRSVSTTEETIKHALQRSSTEPDLIGDFSRAFCLPLVAGRHQDLKSIAPKTLATLMKGGFDETVASYKVIDCRYPYEFDGGHVKDAINLYTKEQILGDLLDGNNVPPTMDPRNKRILVFHCEFSSERGPNLYRFLRNLDRIRNKDIYPALHYPEIYLLEGGYKSFYEDYTELCVPEAYKPMLHPEHQNDLRQFRAKSRTWNADCLRSNRGGLKRLGFL